MGQKAQFLRVVFFELGADDLAEFFVGKRVPVLLLRDTVGEGHDVVLLDLRSP